MKTFLMLLLIAFTGLLHAETINISGGANCGPYRVCVNLPNDVGVDIDIASTPVAGPNPGNPLTTVTIDGKSYVGRMPFTGNYSEFNAKVMASDGSTGDLYVKWHSTSRRAGGPRPYTITTWWFDAGYFSR